jgi:hypothetical protein
LTATPPSGKIPYMETTTETRPNMTEYRACVDMIFNSAVKGEMSFDMAFKIVGTVNTACGEAFTRGYNKARDNYKTY